MEVLKNQPELISCMWILQIIMLATQMSLEARPIKLWKWLLHFLSNGKRFLTHFLMAKNGCLLICWYFCRFQVDAAGRVYRSEMEAKSSFDKINRSSESASTLSNEDFVVVHQQSEDSSAKDEKPQLKVLFSFVFVLNRS